MLLSFGLLLAASCAHHLHEQKSAPSAETVEDVVAKRDLYESLLTGGAGGANEGWVARDCDGLLFSALFASASHAPELFHVELAEDAPGHWLRRPLSMGSCYPEGSKTSISRDMLLGVAFYAWRARKLELAERLVTYGLAHGWVMGEPGDMVSRVVLTPQDIGLFYQIVYRLNGRDHPSRHLPAVWPSGLTGFEAHLQVLSVLLHGEVDDQDGISDEMLARLREHADRQPTNPFFAAALSVYTGDHAAATALLSNEEQWPSASLPGPANHCSPWVVQRDAGDDWMPCGDQPGAVFWGADYVFAADLLTRPRR